MSTKRKIKISVLIGVYKTFIKNKAIHDENAQQNRDKPSLYS